MAETKVAPYGSWKSPITSDLIVKGSIGVGQVALDGDRIYWSEMRPSEGGRSAIVRHTPNGKTEDVTPHPFNARTRVHEYGGGDYTVADGAVYFSNFADQRLYKQTPNSQPEAITPATEMRYADMVIDGERGRIITVREDHTGAGEAVNALVGINLEDGENARVLVSGNDFYSSPRLSSDGKRLAWLTWNHPNMPWDGTELWIGEIDEDGALTNTNQIAGGVEESIFQPEWSPDGTLYFVSDRSNWWNIYRAGRDGKVEAVHERGAEFGQPQWLFGFSMYAFSSPATIVCAYIERDGTHLA